MDCIIVDDSGTDDSIAKVERKIGVYEGPFRFQILHHEHNKGLSAARNTGTEAATGDYIYYLDSDDEITEDCIEKLMAPVLQDPSIEMVQGKRGRYRNYLGDIPSPVKRKLIRSHTLTNKDTQYYGYHLHQLGVAAWNKLIKRSFILQHHLLFKEGFLYEDSLWTFYLMKYVSNVYFVPDITYYYRNRPNSIVTGTDRMTKAYHLCNVHKEIIINLTLGNEYQEYEFFARRFSGFYCRFAYFQPAFRDVFLLYWKKAWQLKCYAIGCKLAVSYVLGLSKWGGKVYAGWRRLRRFVI